MKKLQSKMRSLLCLLTLLASTASALAAGELPVLTTDASDPVLYKIKNTRRAAQGKATYWTLNGLSTSKDEAAVVYFVGEKKGSVVTAKICQEGTGKGLEATINDAAPYTTFSWGEGTDWYFKAYTSAQGGTDATTGSTYRGVLISNASTFPNVGSDVPASDGLGCWYVGSSNTSVWLYGGQWDGSIFTLEILDPSRIPDDPTPVDNGLITNASFETGDLTGWVYATIGGDHGVKENSNGTYTCSNADGDYLYNTWANGDGHIAETQNQCVYQTISGLAPGEYRLTAKFASNNGKALVTLFANNFINEIVPGHKGSMDEVELDGIFITPDVRSLTVGARSAGWFKCDDFKLVSLGETNDYKAYVSKQYADASLKNPVLLDAFDGQKTEAFTYTEIGGHTHGGYPLLTGGTKNDQTMVDRSKMQIWTGDSYQLGDSKTTTTYTGLPNGYYRITSTVRVYDMNGDYNKTATGLSLIANGDKNIISTGTQITAGNASGKGFWGDYSVMTEVKDGTLETGFEISGASFSWLGWQNFRVEYIGTKDPREGMTENPVLAGQMAGICMPYELKSEYFGQLYLVGNIENGNATLVPVESVAAGAPCVLQSNGESNVNIAELTFKFDQPADQVSLWDNTMLRGDLDTRTWTAIPVKGSNIEAKNLTFTVADLSNLTFTATQENNAAARFWSDNPNYSTSSRTVVENYLSMPTYGRRDQPNPILVPVVKNAKSMKLNLSKNADMSDATTTNVAANTTIVELYNLLPGVTYYYNTSDGLSAGQFTVGGTLRMIQVGPNVYNMRDLGGKKTVDGKIVKYGKIFRSGEMTGGYVANSTELAIVKKLGVRCDIDLRNEDGGTSFLTDAKRGENYYWVEGKNYIADGIRSVNDALSRYHWRNEFEIIVKNLRQLKSVDFHCRIGADRTGILGFLLEGLLGVNEADLLRDYETTTFSTAAGTRLKNTNGYDEWMPREFKNKIPAGGTLRDAFETFFTDSLGVKKELIDEFRSIMLADEDPNIDAAYVEQIESVSTLQTTINKARSYVIGDGLGEYTTTDETSVADLTKALEEAEAYLYGRNLDATTTKAYNSDITTKMRTMVSSLTLNMPQAGQAMFLRSNDYGNYISTNGISENGNVYFTMVKNPDETCIFTYDGTNLKHFLTGMYVGSTATTDKLVTAVPAENALAATIAKSTKSTIGRYNIKFTSGTTFALLTSATGSKLTGGSANNTEADLELIATDEPDDDVQALELRNTLNNLKILLENLKKYSIGAGLSQYAPTMGAEKGLQAIADATEFLNSTSQNLAAAKIHLETLTEILNTLKLNMPRAGQQMYIQSASYGSYISCDGTQFPMVSAKGEDCLFTWDGSQFVNNATGLVFSKRPNEYGQGVDSRIMAVAKAEGAPITIKTSCKNTLAAYNLQTKDGNDGVVFLSKPAGQNVDGFYSWLEHEDADVYLVEEAEIPGDDEVEYVQIISAKEGGRAVDVQTQNPSEGRGLILFTNQPNNVSQHWQLKKVGDYYMFLSRLGGWAINDPTTGATTSTTNTGTQLNIVVADATQESQLWRYVELADYPGWGNLINVATDHTMNINGGTDADGTMIISYKSEPTSGNITSLNRRWKLVSVPKGTVPDITPSDNELIRKSDRPLVFIRTKNGVSINNKKNWIDGEIYYVTEQDDTIHYENLQIRARGNSTFSSGQAYKMPYRVKFAEPVQWLGPDRASARNWVLMANAYDKTMMRNALTAELSDFVGLPFSHGAKFVDVVLNEVYVGTYQITDHPEAAPGRVELPEGTGTDQSYFLECDGYAEHTVIRTATKNVAVRIHSPKKEDITTAQKNAVKKFMDDFEKRLFSADFRDAEKGYRPVVDEETLADWYIATEVAANVDGFWSQYFYKKAGDPKLYFGPMWDYDIAYANDDRKGDTSQKLMKDVAYELDHNGSWIVRMWEDPWFQNLICSRYKELMDNGLQEYLISKVDSLANELKETQAVNYKKYGYSTTVLRQRLYHDNYDAYVKDLKDFINTRVPYLTAAFAKLNTNPNAIEFVNAAEANTSTFDLSGRKVKSADSDQKLRKGLYIMGGKKVIVK